MVERSRFSFALLALGTAIAVPATSHATPSGATFPVPLERITARSTVDASLLRDGARDAFVVSVPGHELVLSSTGITSRATPVDELATLRARWTAEIPRVDTELGFATRGGGDRRVHAFVADGKLRVVGDDGRDRARPIRLRPNLARSRCRALRFLSDGDVALTGPAPCIQSRITLRNRRVAPLGSTLVDVASTPDGTRTILLSNGTITLLDGRTGATLATVDPQIANPRSVSIGPDGRFGSVEGDRGFSALDFTSVVAGTSNSVALVTRFVDSWAVGYDLANGFYFGCDARGITLAARTSTGAARAVASNVCASQPGVQSAALAWVARPGFLAVLRGRRFVLVRLRDFTKLEFDVAASPDEVVLILRRGDEALGVFPGGTALVELADAAGRTEPPPTSGAGPVETAVRELIAEN